MRGHVWETLDYFFSWGFFYGLVMGFYVGTGIFPVIGTFFGAVFGGMFGIGLGILSGLMASIIQARFFRDDDDLNDYSRHFARLLGSIGGLGALALLWIYVLLLVSGPDGRDDPTMIALGLLASIPTFLTAGLSAAYTASYYPTAILHRLRKRGKLAAAPEMLPPIRDEVPEALSILAQHPITKWVYLSAGFLSILALLIAAVQWLPITLDEFPAIISAGPAGALVSVVAWFYVSFGNAMILTFLKRVIYRDYLAHLSPHWYRISLTLISFVITWAMIWWTTIPAPILAAIMAFVVYRTIALPDLTLDKAKRKAKNALALEENDEGHDRGILTEQTQQIETREGEQVRSEDSERRLRTPFRGSFP